MGTTLDDEGPQPGVPIQAPDPEDPNYDLPQLPDNLESLPEGSRAGKPGRFHAAGPYTERELNGGRD